MSWIESHQSLGTHLKLRRLARSLRISRAQAIGHLHFLWWWALDNAPSGDLSALTPAEIAEVAEWVDSEEAFVAALKECRWLDADGFLHNWDSYAGRLITEREADRERKRLARETKRKSGERPVEAQPPSNGCPVEVHQESGSTLPNPTQPNPTGQNPTPPPPPVAPVPPANAPDAAEEAKRERGSGEGASGRRPASVEDVIAVGVICGMAEAACREWFRDMELSGWAKVDGTPFGNWKREMTIHRDRLRERASHGKTSQRPDRNQGTANAAVVGQYAADPGIKRC